MATAVERNVGRRQSGRRAERSYVIHDAADEAPARTALLAAAPTSLGALTRYADDCEVDELVEGSKWLGTAVYQLPETQQITQPSGSFQLSFDISGQQQRIMRSIQTVASMPALNHANFGGAINVNSDGTVEGTDILIPFFSFTVTQVYDFEDVDSDYIQDLSNCVGAVNDDTYQGFAEGELLLTRVSGTQRPDPDNEGDWDLTFAFAVSKNATDVTITPTIYEGTDFVFAAKRGWDYLWVFYDDYNDTSNNVVHKRPRYAYIEQVYRYVDYDVL